MSYTGTALAGTAVTLVLDLLVLRTRLVRRRLFWASYAVVLAFQLVVDGVLTGRGVVTYDEHAILGARIVNAPVEDLLFGFALVTQTMSWWAWLGRRAAHRTGA